MIIYLKRNIATALIIIATVVLAGIAIFTAIRLYQLRQEAAVPSSPKSQPKAEGELPTPNQSCTLNFSIEQAPTPTVGPTPTTGPSPTPTPIPTVTNIPTETPTNAPNATSTPTNQPTATSTPTATPTTSVGITSTPTSVPGATATLSPQPTQALTQTSPTTSATLPNTGISTPTLFGIGTGILLFIGALL